MLVTSDEVESCEDDDKYPTRAVEVLKERFRDASEDYDPTQHNDEHIVPIATAKRSRDRDYY